MNPPPLSYIESLRRFSRNARLYLGGSFISNIVVGAFGTLLNLYVLSLGYPKTFVGTLVSVQMFAAGFGALPAGMICDRVGRRKSLMFAALAICAGTLGLAWSSAAPFLIGYEIVYGFGFAFLSVTVAPFLMENSGAAERGHLFGLNFASHMAASMIGNVSSGSIADLLTPIMGKLPAYRATLSMFAVLTAGAAFCYLLIREPRSEGDGTYKRRALTSGLIEGIHLPAVRNLIIYNGLIGLGAGMIVPFFNVFLSEKLSLSATSVGTIQALAQIPTALASLAAPLLVARKGKVRSVVGTQLCSVPFLLMIALPPSMAIVTVSYFIRNALMNMSNPIASNLSMEIVPPGARAAVSSLTRMANDGMRSISALGAGYMMTHISLESPYFVTCGVYLAASAFYYKAFVKYDDHSTPPPIADSVEETV